MLRVFWRSYLRSFQGLPAAAWWIALALFVNRCGAMALTFLTLYVTTRFDLAPTTAGMLLTIYGGGSIISAITGGRLVSRFGALSVLGGSLIGTGAAMLVVMSAATFPQLIWTVLAWSLLAEAARPAAASAAAEVTPGPDQSRALTLNRLAENLGITFGPALGGILAGIDFRLLFVVDAITCWLAAGLVVWLRRSSRRPAPAVAVGVPTSSPLFDGPFLIFLVFMAVLAMALFQLLGTYQLYLAEYGGFTPLHIGLLFAVNTLMIVTMEMPLMHSLRKVPRLILVGIGSCLLCMGFGILAFGDTLVLIGGSLLVWTVGEMLCLSPAMAFVSQRADPANRGSYLGTYTAGISTAFVLAPQVGMRLYESSPRTLWLCMFALAPILLVAFLSLERCSRDEQGVAERLEGLPDTS